MTASQTNTPELTLDNDQISNARAARMARVHQRAEWRQRRIDRFVTAALALWVAIFFDFGGLFRLGGGPRRRGTYVEIVGESIRSGSIKNQILVVSFAAIGCYYLPAAWRWLRQGRNMPLVLLFLYGVWAALSLMWSVDQGLTQRRIIEMLLVAVGCVGLGAGFYGSRPDGRRRLLRDALVVGALGCLIWIPALLSGNINVLAPDWSLIPVGVGDKFGIPIAYGLIAAVVARFWFSSLSYFRPSYLTIYIIVTSVTLVALKKRTLLAGVLIVIAMAVLILVGRTRRRRLGAIFIASAAGGLAIALALGMNPFEAVIPVLTRGEEAQSLTSLTGRVPLWEELLGTYFWDRPIIGYGFGAFWRPEVIGVMWESVGWPATSAHNGLLEELLATGLVGTILLASIWVGIVVGSLRVVFGDRRDDQALVVAAWSALLGFTSLAVATLQLWGELSLMLPLVAYSAIIVWEARETSDEDFGMAGAADDDASGISNVLAPAPPLR
ncbi:MAG TPA: O-antigen ligase family protein [Acidimicrobiia bacterium]|nr:O-antigen ligase family protein [Acidimicrobiia bacterium]